MLFTSYEFIGLIVVLFLVYYLIPSRYQWKLLLVCSYLFYYIAGTSYLIYIMITTLSTYWIGVQIQKQRDRQSTYLREHKAALSKEEKKAYKTQCKKQQWKWLLLCLFLNIGILAVVKYCNFAISNVNAVLGWTGSTRQLDFFSIALPMGISFYTFQAMGYIIDVYRGTSQAEQNPFKFALFVSFFPQLMQGPISRFNDLSETLFAPHPFDKKNIHYGLQRMLWGYFKKLVIADRILVGVNTMLGDAQVYRGAYVFVGMMFYAIELYADFTGGIDMTIGIAQVLGISITENFHRPYFSKSIQEYWRRWHITMGTWFTDYIFYPISVCRPMLRFSKFARGHLGETVGKRLPVYLSSFAVWFATGIWHGASWNFIVWGLGNWLVILVSQELEPLYERFHKRFSVQDKLPYRMFQVARTILLMSCLRTFDCYRDVVLTFRMFGTMFTEHNWAILWNGSLLQIGLSEADYAVLAGGVLLMLLVSLLQRRQPVRDSIARQPYVVQFCIWYGMFLAVLILGAYGVGYDASQFIYNQF